MCSSKRNEAGKKSLISYSTSPNTEEQRLTINNLILNRKVANEIIYNNNVLSDLLK